MKLERIEIQILEFPPNARYKDGVIPEGRPKTWKFPLIAIHTDEGLTGYSMIYGPHGDGPGLADILLNTYWPQIAGKNPCDTESIWNLLMKKQRDFYNLSEALTGVIDVALWDIRGKSENIPVYELLGPKRKAMPCYASCRSPDYSPKEYAEEALELKEAGFKGYKIQVFRKDPIWAATCVARVREAVGEDYPIMVDPNSHWEVEDAILFGIAVNPYKVYWLEEPCDEKDLFAYKQLTQALDIPILAGETLTLAAMKNFFHESAMDLARGDVLIKGGITGMRKLADSCEVFGVGLELHTTNTPILDVANFHVACSIQNTTYIENHHPIFRFALKNNPMEADKNGFVHLPEKPGLGIELDEDWISHHTVARMTARQ